MSEKVFRDKSVAKVKSPDDLNDYIHISNPEVWILLVSIMFLLIGFLCWGIWGQINTSIDVDVLSDNGVVCCYVPANEASKVKVGMKVTVNEVSGVISGEKTRDNNQKVFDVNMSDNLADGSYQGSIILETIRPISFLVN